MRNGLGFFKSSTCESNIDGEREQNVATICVDFFPGSNALQLQMFIKSPRAAGKRSSRVIFVIFVVFFRYLVKFQSCIFTWLQF